MYGADQGGFVCRGGCFPHKNKDNKQTKCKQLEFNTYCIFTEEKKDVKQTIGLIFKDYLENIKIKNK